MEPVSISLKSQGSEACEDQLGYSSKDDIARVEVDCKANEGRSKSRHELRSQGSFASEDQLAPSSELRSPDCFAVEARLKSKKLLDQQTLQQKSSQSEKSKKRSWADDFDSD